MTDDDIGDTVGVWVGEDDDLIDEFDKSFGSEPGYSRSKRIKDAMRLYLTVHDVLDDLEYELGPEVSKRSWVRQSLLDRARKEANED